MAGNNTNAGAATGTSTDRGAGGFYDSSRNNKIEKHDWGNIAVVNTGTNPVINFSFMIRVEGAFDLPCRSVKGFTKENEFDYIQEGGVNDYVHMRRKPISKPFTLQVERYVGVDYVDPLPLGAELVLPVILFVNKYCFPTFKPVATYTFTGCTVISKTTGELNAESSGLFVETTTIAYREMVAVKIPSQAYDLDEKTWDFLEGGSFKGKKGNGQFNRLQSDSNKEYSDSNVIGEKSKAQMSSVADSNVYAINTSSNGRYSQSKQNHKIDTFSAGGAKTKKQMKDAADNNVYSIDTSQGHKYSKSKENHRVMETTELASRSREEMSAFSAQWNPKKPITKGEIDPEMRKLAGKVNGSANHSREAWDLAKRIEIADENKYDIKQKTSSKNGSAKRLGPNSKEPSATAMERKSKKHKYSIKDGTNRATKDSAADAKRSPIRQWPPVKSAQAVTDFLK